MTAKHDDQTADEESSALSRWSRRKAEARQETAEQNQSVTPESDEQTVQPAAGGTALAATDASEHGVEKLDDDQAALTDADMPDIDSLAEGSDFSQFMSPGVSEDLRKRALVRLFKLPFFGVRDGLDDYDDDFRSFLPLGDTITADMKFATRRAEELAKEALEKADEEALAEGESEPALDDAKPESETPEREHMNAIADDGQTEKNNKKITRDHADGFDTDADDEDDDAVGDAEDEFA